MDDPVMLTVGGAGYEGWEEISIVRSIENVAGQFELKLSDLRSPAAQAALKIAPGQECSVAVRGETVITGFIDEIAPSYDKENHTIAVKGRDATADLVDCSAMNSPGQWSGRTLTQIVETLAQPFGIKVRAETDVGAAFEDFALQKGETAFEAIERGCRRAAVLCVSDGLGGLVLTRAGASGGAAAVILGENVLAAQGSFNVKERFHRYIILAQSPGNDFVDPQEIAEAHAEAFDEGVRKARSLIVFNEETEISVSLEKRALWEASVRAGRGRRVEVTVQGWRDGAGRLWRPNTMARYRDALMGVDEDMLIAGVGMNFSNQGSRTTLTLSDARGFDLIPIAARSEGL